MSCGSLGLVIEEGRVAGVACDDVGASEKTVEPMEGTHFFAGEGIRVEEDVSGEKVADDVGEGFRRGGEGKAHGLERRAMPSVEVGLAGALGEERREVRVGGEVGSGEECSQIGEGCGADDPEGTDVFAGEELACGAEVRRFDGYDFRGIGGFGVLRGGEEKIVGIASETVAIKTFEEELGRGGDSAERAQKPIEGAGNGAAGALGNLCEYAHDMQGEVGVLMGGKNLASRRDQRASKRMARRQVAEAARTK